MSDTAPQGPVKREPNELRVLEAYRHSAARTNPYLALLSGSLRHHGVIVHELSFISAAVRRWDLVHVHWPEQLASGRLYRLVVKMPVVVAIVLKVVLTGTPVVRTVHNVAPHEGQGRIQRWIARFLDKHTTVWIVLNDTTPTPDATRTVVVPHGHYRDWYAPYPPRAPHPGACLMFGQIRRYKGAVELVRCFTELKDPLATLALVGSAQDYELRRELEDLASEDGRVALHFDFAPDRDLAEHIYRSEVVILPYTAIENSGSALLALSLGRPVVMPRTESVIALQHEVGDSWVVTYEAPLDAAKLAGALEAARSTARPALPDMPTRDWAVSGEQTRAAFLRALQVDRP